MGSVPPELSLNFKPTFLPKTVNDFLREVSMIGNVSDKVSKLDAFVKGLEEEMKKIDAFKRELPLCMLLLNDAIVALKEELMQCISSKNVKPVLEEFIPLKKSSSDDEDEETPTVKKENDSSKDNKKNWMSSVQLWKTDDHKTTDPIVNPKQNTDLKLKRNDEENPFKSRTEARAFMPFKAYPGFARKEDIEEFPVHGLSLVTPGIKNPKEDTGSSGSRTSCSKSISSSAPNATGPQPPHQQTNRKQRRCWSPELHRRFVNALQQLGGAAAATPKQIRELMQVDGLTNDEVKSHLQKYRLHTRRVPPTTAAAPANHSEVVLASLWMSQDQYGDSSKGSSSQSGSPQGPLQLAGNTGGTSTTGGDSMEDDEDAKSEGHSWKSQMNKPGKDDV
ncbi:transcription factor HHO6 [Mangifera indica]|uniref:transcription factor HHO6 n=1 Tax=Mangifera indica TaxID=29780 RepID=UPI001CFC41F3|nr:transcription factor HHO6 [Mangifera indica]